MQITSDPGYRYNLLRNRLAAACQRARRRPEEVTLVVVTKGFLASAIVEAHKLGIRHFGENRVQEARAKFSSLPSLSPELI